MQFEMGISISRYIPANGTAGLLRIEVNGASRVPRPPPKTSATTFRICHQISLFSPLEFVQRQSGGIYDYFFTLPLYPLVVIAVHSDKPIFGSHAEYGTETNRTQDFTNL